MAASLLWKCYTQGTPQNKQHYCFLRGALNISRINDFYKSTLGRWRQIKTKTLVSGHYTFWKCYAQCAPRKNQYHCFIHGLPKSQEKVTFPHVP